MGFKMRVIEDKVDLQVLIKDSDAIGEKIMNRCGKVIKTRVESNLNSIRTQQMTHKHMADDVVVRTGKDKYGYRYTKVGGGKETGTLWHIVNDGTYVSDPTHFMDNAISQSENDIQQIIDEELSKTNGK